MAYNWRKVFWYGAEGVAYGVHGNSGYLFRFDPHRKEIELVERITSSPSRRSGMFDQFSYGYLGYQLGPDGQTIYYLTGAPVFIDGKRVQGAEEIAKGAASGLENLHLVTYHIPERKYTVQGLVFFWILAIPTFVIWLQMDVTGKIFH